MDGNLDGPIYSIEDIFNANLSNQRSQITRANKIDEFRGWLQHRREIGCYGPTINEIKLLQNKQPFFDIIPKYFEYRFNITYNKPNSFDADLGAIKHWLRLNGIYTDNNTHYPWYRYFKAGVKNICVNVLNQKIGLARLAIFNPILEALLEYASNTYVILALLLAQRFCLRAQHYLKTSSKADFITLGQIEFMYDNFDNVTSMTIWNTRDKNHKSSHAMHRTIYCCCKTDWTCLPCFAEPIVFSRRERGCPPTQPLILKGGSHMKYAWFNDKLKQLVLQLGIDNQYYSTHSLRAGGATELHLAGYSILDSVLDYIRPNNPHMKHFVPNVDFYYKSRRCKSVLFADDDENMLQLLKRKRSFN